MNDRHQRPARAVAAIAIAMTVAACGAGSPRAASRTEPTEAQAQMQTLRFARCMRAHGVPRFPDDLQYQNVPGIDPASPAFTSAQARCNHLLPVKRPPAAAPSSRTEAKLLRLSQCLRAHGYPSMPDPRPNPPPQGGTSRYDTLFGEGDYWIGIPKPINAHGAPFIRALHECHANP